MRKAGIPPKKQADHSWRGSHLRNIQNGQMQEMSVLGRLLNATIVVCGACYILYVAVYLGLDLKSIVSKPLRETVNVRLRLRTNPTPWEGQEPLQLHSAGQRGVWGSNADPHDTYSEKTSEEPVPGVGMLADETRAETAELRPDDSRAESSHPDIDITFASAGKPGGEEDSLISAGKHPAEDPWLESAGAEDRPQPESLSRDTMDNMDDLPETAEEKQSAKADSLLQGLRESDLGQEDEDAPIGNARSAAKSGMIEEVTARAAEPERESLLLDSELAADRDTAGTSESAIKLLASETARADAATAEHEHTAMKDDETKSTDPLESEDDLLMREDDSRGNSSLQMGREGAGAVTPSELRSDAERADRDIEEDNYMIARMDEEGEFWEDDMLLEEDGLLESDDDREALDH